MAANAQRDEVNEASADELRAELARLKSDVSQLTDTVKNLAEQKATDGRESAAQAAERSREHARDALGNLGHEISERPLTSVATAFSVGFVIGKLIER